MTLNALEVASIRSTVSATQLDMLCTVQRASSGTPDPYGHGTVTWANHLTGVRCHYWEEAETEMVGTPNATVTRERIVLAANSDVTTKDRISQVIGIDGVQVAGQLAIIEVIKAIQHTLLIVKAVG